MNRFMWFCFLFMIVWLVGCNEKAPPTVLPTQTAEPTAAATPSLVSHPTFPPAITPSPIPTPIHDPTSWLDVDYPVTYFGYLTTDITTLDPQIAEDGDAAAFVANLFMQLTHYDPATGQIMPEAATSWVSSAAATVYTFTLRTDIPWVYHNPVTSETVQVTDETGQPRFVTADDFVYGIKRNCRLESGSYYGDYVVAPVVVGCAAALEPETADLTLYEAIGVYAPTPDTLVIRLTRPAVDFLALTAMWYFSAVPEGTINQFGEDWIEAGTIVTNGRFALDQWIHNVQIIARRNPFLPPDLIGQGNIERVVMHIVLDVDTGYALWRDNQVDISGIPFRGETTHLSNYPDETILVSDSAVFYIGIRTSKPPFDDVRVRRAFSAAFDREGYIATVRQGGGLPMIHLVPPQLVGAAALDSPGAGFNPEYAREQLAAAGYPNCEGFPTIILSGYTGQPTLHWLEFAQQTWQEHLGCTRNQIVLEQLAIQCITTYCPSVPPFGYAENEFGNELTADDNLWPHMWTQAWGSDYPDTYEVFSEIIWCEIHPTLKRECGEVDDLLAAAQSETDPTQRAALFWQIEDLLFGAEGEFPLIPIFLRASYVAQHTWLTTPTTNVWATQWYDWTIDAELQAAARRK